MLLVAISPKKTASKKRAVQPLRVDDATPTNCLPMATTATAVRTPTATDLQPPDVPVLCLGPLTGLSNGRLDILVGIRATLYDHRTHAALHHSIARVCACFTSGLIAAAQVAVTKYAAAIDAVSRVSRRRIGRLNRGAASQAGSCK